MCSHTQGDYSVATILDVPCGRQISLAVAFSSQESRMLEGDSVANLHVCTLISSL